MKKITSLIIACLICAAPALAQEIEMADTMRSNGKIYVVVSILLVILAGLLTYVVLLDRKTSRLEKRLGEHK